MNTIKHKSIKENKAEVITIRVTPGTKKKLKKKARDSGSSLSEYLIANGLDSRMRKAENKTSVFSAVIVQQICTYLEENYGEDQSLEEWRRKLWENL